jgi:hypothetical protein
MAARGTGFTGPRLRVGILGCLLCALLASASSAAGAGSASKPRPNAVESLSQPKTPFQCERRFHTSQGRARCFSTLPGSSCAHPLVAEKADYTTRGEHRYFRLGFRGDSYEGGVDLNYSYAPASSNVAMCPYPIGAVYKDSLLDYERNRCQQVHRNGKVFEECSDEYDTHNHPEPVGRHGGSFTFDLKSPRTGYLVVKGYFIHPPWEH